VNISIKDFDVEMKVKNNGFELDVSDNQGAHLGDLFVTKTGLTWCQGKTRRENGRTIKWNKFIDFMMSAELK
jgi:hypothetical protein